MEVALCEQLQPLFSTLRAQRLKPVQSSTIKLSTAEIAALTDGQVEGDVQVVITYLASIEQGSEGALSFFSDPRYEAYLYETRSSAVLVREDFRSDRPIHPVLIRVKNPQLAFTQLMSTIFNPDSRRVGIEVGAVVAPDAIIAPDAYVGALAYVGSGSRVASGAQIHPGAIVGDSCSIGENAVIYSNVTLYSRTFVGARSIIHGGTVIGADGFGYIQHEGKSIKIPQIGHVIIENDVEIGANCTIDRGAIGPTVIRSGTKIDNLVHLAHNVEVGEDNIVAAQVGIAGSTKLGKRVMLGGQVGIMPHVRLADFTQVGAQTGISKTVKATGKMLRGSPARDINHQLKIEASMGQLPALIKRMEELERLLAAEQDVKPTEAHPSNGTAANGIGH
jgi:UDP-3-O-[3-hydroxymyristoyl] glucosamine N-acyltransferase